MLQNQLENLQRSKKAYDKAYRESDKALENFQKADADLHLSRAEVIFFYFYFFFNSISPFTGGETKGQSGAQDAGVRHRQKRVRDAIATHERIATATFQIGYARRVSAVAGFGREAHKKYQEFHSQFGRHRTQRVSYNQQVSGWYFEGGRHHQRERGE